MRDNREVIRRSQREEDFGIHVEIYFSLYSAGNHATALNNGKVPADTSRCK